VAIVRNNGLPLQGEIGHSIDDIKDVDGVSLIQGDCDYVSACTRERRDAPFVDHGTPLKAANLFPTFSLSGVRAARS